MEPTMSFGYWLRRRRKALDLTQAELAQRVGCATGTIKHIEADERRPSRQMGARLAECLRIPPEDRAAFISAARAELSPDRLLRTTQPLQRAEESTASPSERQPLPSGTVTFLFTDIEGSTQLWEQHQEAMHHALARHDAILRQAITAHSGHMFKTMGDAVYAAFASAPDALAAALAAQRALLMEDWGKVGAMHVRMALHTGTAQAYAGDYIGLPLNRAARLLSAGHGGQILLSRATQELLRDDLPPDLELRDLGEHQLKDLIRPEHLYQLVAPDLPANFPPLRTLDRHITNLPAQPTALIGRENEVAVVRNILRRSEVRLVTLTGPGGTGKTRLALQVASELLDEFPHGIWFVNLAPISDPALVIATITQTLGVKESGGQSFVESLKAYLHEKQLLLLLDNFEQVADAAVSVAELLAVAPGLKVLITSRAVLHLSGEHEFAVPPLALPEREPGADLARLTQYAAVRLFIERAQAVRADFAVTNENAPAVAEICHRLDGLPLAIELAAARVKLFPPEVLLARLSNRLAVLIGGPRDVPARQQTLRNTIDWSYHLLDVGEQLLFRRLAVFVGGCTLAAVEAICNAAGDLPMSVLDGLAALVDKSLLRHEEEVDGKPRFWMLETICEYALEHLVASGELEVLRQRHAAFFVTLAEAAKLALIGPQQVMWMDRLETEYPNLRAALVWSRTEADGTMGLRLAVAMGAFWARRGYLSEGRGWLQLQLTPRAGGTSRPHTAASRSLRAKALSRLGDMAAWQSDLAAAQPAIEDSLVLFRELGDTWSIADALSSLGMGVLLRGDHERSAALLEESLTLFRQLEDIGGIGGCFFMMGTLAYAQGNLRRASELWEEGLTLSRSLGNPWMIACCLMHLGMVALDQGDYGRAGAYLAESLTLLRELGDRWQTVLALDVCAGLAAAQGHQRIDAEPAGLRAARIFGAAEALRETLGAPILPIYRDHYQRGVAAARAHLDEATFGAAWAEGRALTLEQAIAYALDTGNNATEPPRLDQAAV